MMRFLSLLIILTSLFCYAFSSTTVKPVISLDFLLFSTIKDYLISHFIIGVKKENSKNY